MALHEVIDEMQNRKMAPPPKRLQDLLLELELEIVRYVCDHPE
jgi:hypothetical protein